MVSEKIDNLAQSGKVNIADIEWMARSTDDLKIIPAGRKVKICSIEGVKAAAELVEELGGEVVKMLFLIELSDLNGREVLKDYDVDSVVQFEGK